MEAPDNTDEAARVDLIRRRVLNVVGHELRTPFTTLRGLTDQLVDADPDELAVLAPSIARLAARIDDLLDDLLVAAGVSTAEPIGEPSTLALGDLVGELWTAHGGDPNDLVGTATTVTARPAAVRSAVGRVIENAFELGESPRRATLEGSSVAVHSRAPGLSSDELDLAFELFYRGERAVMTRPGLGLGLPIARELAEREGGSATARLADDELVVTLTFPT